MFKETPESIQPREVQILVRGQNLDIRIVGDDDQADLAVRVDDTTSREQITRAAQAELEKQYWFTGPKWENEDLKERLKIKLEEKVVELFVFGEHLPDLSRTKIVNTLKTFYSRLKDKSLWSLESIQILPRIEVNSKNGEQFRGMEFPNQRRLEIYPAGMQSTEYRNGELPCSELEGTLVHEVTHIVLEKTLASLWLTRDLGWERLNDILIELPGGDKTENFNARPEECPTSYGSLQPDDDRADSVVAYLFAPESLHKDRKAILDDIFDEGSEIRVSASPLHNTLPEIPQGLTISVIPNQKNQFGSISVVAGNERRIITLNDYRRERGVQT
jgi:hypothetical protein